MEKLTTIGKSLKAIISLTNAAVAQAFNLRSSKPVWQMVVIKQPGNVYHRAKHLMPIQPKNPDRFL